MVRLPFIRIAGRMTVMEPNDTRHEAYGSKPDVIGDLQTLPVPEVEKRLGSSPDGLTQVEAERRLTQFGPNEIVEKTVNPLLKFLTYLWGPIPWMIEAAVILSGVLKHWPDFFIILVLLLANAGVGFWEEHQAGKAISALKAELAIKARVKRDGEWVTPPSRELVPGDVIRLRLGDIVPADARLLDGDPIEVDQSALTGESLPASCQTGDAVFSASIVRQGEIGALVYATGADTYFGKTAELVQEAQTVNHFQRAVLKIGIFLIILALAMVVVIIGVSTVRGDAFFTTLQFALVLTVAAIPVAMPTVLSVTMAVGARVLASKKAIVSRLVAIEELAGVDVLCTDKTGTLTQNTLTLGDPYTVGTRTAGQVILDASLASRADDADAIDLAVLGGLTNDHSLDGYHVTQFQLFDAVRKCTEAAVTATDGSSFKVTKGAPQVILELSANASEVKTGVEAAVNRFAARGFRSLGVARADGGGPWSFVGVLPLFDPPREDANAGGARPVDAVEGPQRRLSSTMATPSSTRPSRCIASSHVTSSRSARVRATRPTPSSTTQMRISTFRSRRRRAHSRRRGWRGKWHAPGRLAELPMGTVKEIEYVLDLAPRFLWVVGPGSVDPTIQCSR